VPEDYVHRIGRTGRAGSSGEALSLVDTEEKGLLHGIQRMLRRDITLLDTPDMDIAALRAASREAKHTRPAERRKTDSAHPVRHSDARAKATQDKRHPPRRRRGQGAKQRQRYGNGA